mmetsp:Transcript_8235/g.37523  ORF Transcript_8235/g.37523 Transcript_8235/m.37523 type:complete len:258 (+) Transcript_8235:751-1524(+)
MTHTFVSSSTEYSTSTSQSTTRYVSNRFRAAAARRSLTARMSSARTSRTISTNAVPLGYSASGGARPARRRSFSSFRLAFFSSTLSPSSRPVPSLPRCRRIPPAGDGPVEPPSFASFASRTRRRSATARTYAAATSSAAPSASSTRVIFSGSSLSAASLPTHAGAAASSTLSQKGTYGLTSSTGVPSTRSAPASVSVPARASTETTRPRLSPIGSGRCGVRVASAPTVLPSSLGTRTFALTAPPLRVSPALVLAWKT